MRVKFYSLSDWSTGKEFKRALSLLDAYHDCSIKDVADAVEFYNIVKFFKAGVRHPDHDDETHKRYYDLSRKASGDAVRFIVVRLGEVGIRDLIAGTDHVDRKEVWEIVCVSDSLGLISDGDVTYMFDAGDIAPHQFFGNQKLATRYSSVLFGIIMAHPEQYMRMVLDEKVTRHVENRTPLYLPRELGTTEIIELADAYIASVHVHPDHLKTIHSSDGKSKFTFPKKTRLAALRRYEAEWERLSENAIVYGFGVGTDFAKGQKGIVEAKREGTNTLYSYQWEWVNDNLDFPTLLNNFIYLFGYTDFHCRIALVSNPAELGLTEKVFSPTPKTTYATGAEFGKKEMRSISAMMTYRSLLSSFDIRLEEVIEWYFNVGIKEAFEVEGFKVALPTEDSAFAEKCRTIAPEFEAVLKRFSTFVNEGEIDEDMLQFVGSTKVRDVPSLTQDKYVYGIGDDFNTAAFLLCSFQSGLAHNENFELEAKTSDTLS